MASTTVPTPAPTPPHRGRATEDEHLATGWEPDAPVGDTLLRRFVYNLAATWEASTVAMGGRAVRCSTYAAADVGRPAGYWNGATLLQPLPPGDPTATDLVLDSVEDFFRGGGCGDVLLWSAWPTPDLRGRGWRLEGHPPLLIRPPAPVPDEPRGTPRTEALRVERVSDVARLRDFERVAVEGYPLTDLQPLTPGSLFDERVLADPRLRLWVGYDAGRAVAIGSLFVAYGLSAFMLGVTLPDARHRGYWAAMARHRLRAVPDVPAAGLFSDMSRPGAERRLAFLPITRFTLSSRSRPTRTGRDLEPYTPSGR